MTEEILKAAIIRLKSGATEYAIIKDLCIDQQLLKLLTKSYSTLLH